MTYFTILHWLAVIFFLLVYVLLIYLSKKTSKDNKIFLAMLFASTAATLMAIVFAVLILDKYTKKAALFNVKNSRLLNTEEMIIQGQVQNIGKFKIGRCKINIRIVNQGLSRGTNLTGSVVFTPRSWFDFSSKKDDQRFNVLEINEVIATNLKPGEYDTFVIRFKYPPHFSNAIIVGPKLDCK